MVSVGFIGLGTMGAPMAANLLKAGYAVTVYNRSRDKVQALAALGASTADSPAEAARSADVLFTMVSDNQAIEEVIFGGAAEGVLAGASPGLVVFDCSTVSPECSRKLHRELAARNIEFLDAPVTGSKPAAEDGSIVFIVGGNEEVLEKHRDLLLAMGAGYRYMGPAGSGSETKLALNAIVGINMAGLAEGLAMAAASGVDLDAFVDLVLSGGSSSRMAELKGKRVLSGELSPQFALKLMLKDLQLALHLSERTKVETPMLAAAEALFRRGKAKGLGDEDLSAVVRIYEEQQSGRLPIAGKHNAAEQAPSPRAAVPAASDRRKEARIPLGIPLQVSVHQWEKEGAFSGQTVSATLQDLSGSGMKIVSGTPLAVDMFIVIYFPKEAGLPPLIGKIIRIDRINDTFHYGCLLSGLSPYVRLKLQAFIKHHLQMLKA